MNKKFLISAVIAAALLLTGLWLVIDVEDIAPVQNEMRNGCVFQKVGSQWIKTCG